MPIWHRKLTEHIDRRVSNPTIAALYQRWMDRRAWLRPAARDGHVAPAVQEGHEAAAPVKALPELAHFDLNTLADWAPCLMLLRQLGDDFCYEHYGSDIARHAQFDMTGRLVSSFGGELAEFFTACYRACLASGEPLYTVHYADRARSVFTWERLLLPLRDEQGGAWLLVYNRPLQSRLDLQQQVLNANSDAILALQPVLDDDGRVLQWLVLMLNDAMAALAGLAQPAAVGLGASEVLLRWAELGIESACSALYGRADASGAMPPTTRELDLELTVGGQLRRYRVHLNRVSDGCVVRLVEQRPLDHPAAATANPSWLPLILDELRHLRALPPGRWQAALDALLGQLNDTEPVDSDAAEDAPTPGLALRDWLRQMRDTLAPQAHQQGLSLLVEMAPDVPNWLLPSPRRWHTSVEHLAAWLLERAAVEASASPQRLHLRLATQGLDLVLLMQLPGASAHTPLPAFRLTQLQHKLALWGAQLIVQPSGSALELRMPRLSTLQPVAASHPGADLGAATTPASRPAADGIRVLVVEDDAVNQLVLRRQLELLGCRVSLANDGEEALLAWQQAQAPGAERHELVLSDLHMPRLDGFGLAREMRRRELAQLQPRTPLVAITANADGEDANLALAAGMDDVLGKPVQLARLRDCLARWASASSAGALPRPQRALTAQQAANELPVFDVQVLRKLLADDEAAVQELLADYLGSARHLAAEMRQAFTDGDASQLAAIAHKLKSASQAVGAQALSDLCGQLERRRMLDDPEAVSASLQHFDAAMSAVTSRIEQHLHEHTANSATHPGPPAAPHP